MSAGCRANRRPPPPPPPLRRATLVGVGSIGECPLVTFRRMVELTDLWLKPCGSTVFLRTCIRRVTVDIKIHLSLNSYILLCCCVGVISDSRITCLRFFSLVFFCCFQCCSFFCFCFLLVCAICPFLFLCCPSQLVGACINQHPELFAAAVAQVLRWHLFIAMAMASIPVTKGFGEVLAGNDCHRELFIKRKTRKFWQRVVASLFEVALAAWFR